ncbi:MAG: HD domain-containing protein [Candidatus Omnitrophica bacterium]|nr:HD domain-containing protein [Candidatus Omnitrophota bacterium]MDD5079698.1 HD domain-containing protein [Candidatus Omnitrophota bacterium]
MEDLRLLFLITKLLGKNKPILEHGRRVAKLACAIGETMKYCDAGLEHIRFAAIVHDIGKTRLLADIVNKPGALDENERVLIRRHPELGYRLLKFVRSDLIVAEVALQHHERMDGSGYPFGLKAKDINPVSRIITVCDVIDTMVSPQVYRPALSMDKALEEIAKNSGSLYDPKVADVILAFGKKGKLGG